MGKINFDDYKFLKGEFSNVALCSDIKDFIYMRIKFLNDSNESDITLLKQLEEMEKQEDFSCDINAWLEISPKDETDVDTKEIKKLIHEKKIDLLKNIQSRKNRLIKLEQIREKLNVPKKK